jgi:hypothetical protein
MRDYPLSKKLSRGKLRKFTISPEEKENRKDPGTNPGKNLTASG